MNKIEKNPYKQYLKPTKKGFWIRKSLYDDVITCPFCNCDYNDYEAGGDPFHFCPNCGSQLEEISKFF